MTDFLSRLLDRLSDYLALRKGLLPILGIVLVAANFVLSFFNLGWVTDSDLLLHLGVVVAILGIMMAWAL
ncbi:MAG TPA: hypothetical protein PKW33_15260 [Anaerolineaceae bacterium]|nr:hypothetical protein [Anaerolineaceae bacterium]HPN52952.1 hypothetical protein [Anaerolineaceae bacterium]